MQSIYGDQQKWLKSNNLYWVKTFVVKQQRFSPSFHFGYVLIKQVKSILLIISLVSVHIYVPYFDNYHFLVLFSVCLNSIVANLFLLIFNFVVCSNKHTYYNKSAIFLFIYFSRN